VKSYRVRLNAEFRAPSNREILTRPYLANWPSVTILIPTLNAMGWFRESYAAFLEQDYAGAYDILVIDSGSTDGTVAFLQNQDRTTVHSIAAEDFGHGNTRNLGATLAKGDLVLMTVQDARPPHSSWITNMVQSLESQQLDGVCGKQAVPCDEEKNPLQWYRPISEPSEDDVFDNTSVENTSPLEKLRACSWDNVNALYRKSSLLAQPFRDVRFGEDMFWALDMLTANGKIGYTHRSKVWHYHHQHQGFTRKRVFYTHYWRYKAFQCLPKPRSNCGFIDSLRVTKTLVRHAQIFNPVVLVKWLKYNRQIAKESTEITEEFLKAVQGGDAALDNLYASFGAQSPMAIPTQPT
jgi:rhamnosyltransferase